MKKHQHFKRYSKFKTINLAQKKKHSVKIWKSEHFGAKKKATGHPIQKAIYLRRL